MTHSSSKDYRKSKNSRAWQILQAKNASNAFQSRNCAGTILSAHFLKSASFEKSILDYSVLPESETGILCRDNADRRRTVSGIFCLISGSALAWNPIRNMQDRLAYGVINGVKCFNVPLYLHLSLHFKIVFIFHYLLLFPYLFIYLFFLIYFLIFPYLFSYFISLFISICIYMFLPYLII